MIERDIDCRKHRKSTHLASVDLDIMASEGKALVFEVVDAVYNPKEMVNGKETEGYFLTLKGVKKKFMLNTTANKNSLSELCRLKGMTKVDSYNIKNWVGLVLELYVDRNVSLMKKTVDGIRIMKKEGVINKPELLPSMEKWNEAVEYLKKEDSSIENIKKHWSLSEENEKLLNK